MAEYCFSMRLPATCFNGGSPDYFWGERIKALFNAHPTVNLRAMQFPANWQNLPPWI
jgi:hypothetical protein